MHMASGLEQRPTTDCVACLNPCDKFAVFNKENLIQQAEVYLNDFSPDDIIKLSNQLEKCVFVMWSNEEFLKLKKMRDPAKKHSILKVKTCWIHHTTEPLVNYIHNSWSQMDSTLIISNQKGKSMPPVVTCAIGEEEQKYNQKEISIHQNNRITLEQNTGISYIYCLVLICYLSRIG